jgi:DNA replication ATP-dependent helicase Dna2
MLRWLEIACLTQRKLHVLVVAFTNTAIEKLMLDLNERLELWQAARSKIQQSQNVAQLQVCLRRLSASAAKAKETADADGEQDAADAISEPCLQAVDPARCKPLLAQQQLLVLGATVWQVAKLPSGVMFDALVIDEGSQLPLIDSAIAFERLHIDDAERVIVAGDHLQLPPIIHASYPLPDDPEHPALYGSVLHALMRDQNGQRIDAPHLDTARAQQGILTVTLTENRRSNQHLSRFTEHLYSNLYKCINTRKHLRVRSPPTTATTTTTDDSQQPTAEGPLSAALLGTEVPALISCHIALTAATLVASMDQQLSIEADLIVRLVQQLLEHCTPARPTPFSCFVVTPHRNQRAAIQRRLRTLLRDTCPTNAKITVDTVERMQGQQADVVIVALGILDADRVAEELDFIYSLQRLNVAFSRAERTCILVASKAVLEPDVSVLGSTDRSRAYELLHVFEKQAQLDIVVTYDQTFDSQRNPTPPQVQCTMRDNSVGRFCKE